MAKPKRIAPAWERIRENTRRRFARAARAGRLDELYDKIERDGAKYYALIFGPEPRLRRIRNRG